MVGTALAFLYFSFLFFFLFFFIGGGKKMRLAKELVSFGKPCCVIGRLSPSRLITLKEQEQCAERQTYFDPPFCF